MKSVQERTQDIELGLSFVSGFCELAEPGRMRVTFLRLSKMHEEEPYHDNQMESFDVYSAEMMRVEGRRLGGRG